MSDHAAETPYEFGADCDGTHLTLTLKVEGRQFIVRGPAGDADSLLARARQKCLEVLGPDFDGEPVQSVEFALRALIDTVGQEGEPRPPLFGE